MVLFRVGIVVGWLVWFGPLWNWLVVLFLVGLVFFVGIAFWLVLVGGLVLGWCCLLVGVVWVPFGIGWWFRFWLIWFGFLVGVVFWVGIFVWHWLVFLVLGCVCAQLTPETLRSLRPFHVDT